MSKKQPKEGGKAWEKSFARAAGARLRSAREAAGLSRPDLAGLVDTDISQICRWEQGHVLPRLHWIARLAKALRVDADRLIPEP